MTTVITNDPSQEHEDECELCGCEIGAVIWGVHSNGKVYCPRCYSANVDSALKPIKCSACSCEHAATNILEKCPNCRARATLKPVQ